jgi:hypothetical protein
VKILKLHEIFAPLLGSQRIVLLFRLVPIFIWSSDALCLGGSELFSFDLFLMQRSLFRSKERSLHKLKAGFSKHRLSTLLGIGIIAILRL